MRVLDIKEGTIVDGVGLRTSVYFAGCKHRCDGCHNPQSWDMKGGKEMTIGAILHVIYQNKFNVTLTGGDPLFQDLYELHDLVRSVKEMGLTIWLYTGFTFNQLMMKCADDKTGKLHRLLEDIDVIVDGRFDKNRKKDGLRFRGSSNQHILDMKASLAAGKPIELSID